MSLDQFKMSVNRRLLVLYGSETGNAQDVAEELAQLGQRLRFNTSITEMNAVEIVSVIVSE